MRRSSSRWTQAELIEHRGWAQRWDQRGFTLIELMVVVLIVGLLAAVMVVSVGITGRDSELEQEGQRAFSLMKYVREKAELQTREFGLYCGDGQYEFLTYDPRKLIWRSVDEDESLRLRELPEGLKLRLIVEGREIVLKGPDTEQKTEEQLKKAEAERVPHVILYSNGDLTPFKLIVVRDQPVRSVSIASNDEGVLESGDVVEGKT
jgi:general secretion pathway protein H